MSSNKLSEWIREVAEIICSKCSTQDDADTYDPENTFYDYGWRATEKHCYCPDCAKKYLKQ